jgi:hypothetical protein
MGELDIFWGVLYGVCFTLMMCVGLALSNPFFRVDMGRRLLKRNYAIAELDQDSAQYAVKIIKTTDLSVLFNSRAYRVYPERFKMHGGVPVIRYHHSSTEPICPREFEAVKTVYYMPARLVGTAAITVTEGKTTHTTSIDVDTDTGGFQPGKDKDGKIQWQQIGEDIKKYFHISSPSELADFLLGKQVEAEARAIIMGFNEILKLRQLLYIVIIITGVSMIAIAVVYMQVDSLNTKMNTVVPTLNTMNASIAEIHNVTSRFLVPGGN